jgi:hypothetical protein
MMDRCSTNGSLVTRDLVSESFDQQDVVVENMKHALEWIESHLAINKKETL